MLAKDAKWLFLHSKSKDVRFLKRFYNNHFSKHSEFAKRIKSITGFTPSNLSMFILAFSHRSNPSEKAYAIQNNERLEYLGDAVLGTIVAEYLFKKYPNGNEGFLTKMRSKIVKRKSLNKIGDKMGLDMLLAEYNNTRLSHSTERFWTPYLRLRTAMDAL